MSSVYIYAVQLPTFDYTYMNKSNVKQTNQFSYSFIIIHIYNVMSYIVIDEPHNTTVNSLVSGLIRVHAKCPCKTELSKSRYVLLCCFFLTFS